MISFLCSRSFYLCKHTFTNCKYNDNRTFPHSRKLPPHRHKNHLVEMMPNKRCLVQVIALNSAHLVKSPFLVLRWPERHLIPAWYIKNVFHTMRRHVISQTYSWSNLEHNECHSVKKQPGQFYLKISLWSTRALLQGIPLVQYALHVLWNLSGKPYYYGSGCMTDWTQLEYAL